MRQTWQPIFRFILLALQRDGVVPTGWSGGVGAGAAAAANSSAGAPRPVGALPPQRAWPSWLMRAVITPCLAPATAWGSWLICGWCIVLFRTAWPVDPLPAGLLLSWWSSGVQEAGCSRYSGKLEVAGRARWLSAL